MYTGHGHPPVRQKVFTTSPQSYNPAEHLVLFRTSNPVKIGQLQPPVLQGV